MKKRIGLKVLSIFILIFLICGTGISVVTVKISQMDAVNDNIGGDYLSGIEELDNVSLDVEYMKNYLKNYLLTNVNDTTAKSQIQNKVTEIQQNLKASLSKLKSYSKYERQRRTNIALNDAYSTYSTRYEELMRGIDMGVINDVNVLDEKVSKAEQDLQIRIKSMEIINTTNMIRARNELSSATQSCYIVVGIVIISFALTFLLGVIITYRTIVVPTKHAKGELDDIIGSIEAQEGNLTKRVQERTKDEVGQLVGGINKFIETLQNVICQIKEQSGAMIENVRVVNEQISNADASITDVSATMQELAVSMTEISDVADNINDKTEEVNQSVEKISEAADKGTQYAQEIQKRAEEFKEKGISSKNTTGAMAEEIRSVLEVALEKSRDVEKINNLTTDILNISSQTNLLALNASIEAARAGEAGKGFAVVADEIRQLADLSRETANNIQEISTQVTGSVNELAGNANKMIDFILEVVLPDYDNFVITGNKYSEDATSFEGILENFAVGAGDLREAMKNVKDMVQNISVTIGESTHGINVAAENASNLTGSVSQIKNEIDKTEHSADKLIDGIDMFKYV